MPDEARTYRAVKSHRAPGTQLTALMECTALVGPARPGWLGAGHSSPEKRSQADCRVMPRAAPIWAHVAPSERALRTQ
jgi:hypothetical protein